MINNSLSRLHLEREFYSKIIEKYDRLSPKLVRDTVHLYSRIGRRRYISYAFEIDTIMRRLELKDILDWGALYGHMSFLLNSLGQNVAAMDVAGGLAKVDYDDITPIFEFPIRMVVDHENIPYPDNSFDALLSMGVLEHVNNIQKSMEEIHRILKPGGILFVFHLPNKYSWIEFINDIRNRSDHPIKFSKKEFLLVKNSG